MKCEELLDVRVDCKGLLFDMDGVLLDSTVAVARVWSQWAVEKGFDPKHVSHIAQGRPSLTTIRELLPGADHDAENRIVERREMDDIEGVMACDGARDLLASLPPERWALVTSSTRPLAKVRLAAGGLSVPERMITGNDIEHGKPHPEPFLKGAALVGIAPQDCVVVEDTAAGVRAGKAAGCRVLAFRTTMTDAVLEAARPDWIVDNCAHVHLENVTSSGDLVLLIHTQRQSGFVMRNPRPNGWQNRQAELRIANFGLRVFIPSKPATAQLRVSAPSRNSRPRRWP